MTANPLCCRPLGAVLVGAMAVIAFELGLTTPARAVPVDIELVLAVDCSRSIDDDEFALQIRGYASALVHPSVVKAIQSGQRRAIAVTYVQWAGPLLQAQVLPWTLISDRESAEEFSERMVATPRNFRGGGTSLSGIIDYARPIFAKNDFEGERLVVDISGDGINNSGRQPQSARDDAVAAGIVINGLPILTEVPWLDDYFREYVIGGPGAFVIVAASFDAFAAAIRNKLIREIAGEDFWRAIAEAAPALP
jgi:hypothetical protein